ncbi:beta-1,6-N-acetylglucosaminyltransferase [Tolypothrix sp. VBCCA 56010]|uniref:beta-1,6-N-acetylglucosaminyltransferase n=1 Tax=Tolypothrix sp. VBCCA 56010 TaxID=3137731 RepID=UPI003D7C9632
MKVCYLIQSHRNPQQIYRLIDIIKKSSPEAQVIVSHNFSCCELDVRTLENSGVQVLTGKGGRGDFMLLQSYLDAIKWLIDNQINYDWLIYLSGQDYPIKPISNIENFLAETNYDGFIEYFNIFSPESHWSIKEATSRYLFRYKKINYLTKLPNWVKELLTPIKIINYLQPFVRINLAYDMLGVRALSLLIKDFVFYGGSFFTTLSRKCVEYLHQFCQSHPEVVKYYKGVCVADESFLQTILVNSGLFNLCNDNKRYYDFSQSRNGHPAILTTNDYNAIIQSDAHFARKFDICKDRRILDLLDKEIGKVVFYS